MTPAEQAYENWVDVGNNRYGSVHRDAFIAGFKAGSTATFEQGYTQGFRACITSQQPRSASQTSVDHPIPIDQAKPE
jgi:hypothetical protein